ncbi:polyketide synthase [Apostichopus japonicus]|uniref:Polyketide synthase n=1 Tax=Stichopus japonicus TaxID=307972 RepID=A0A2G8JZ53_STIJA|nr:polyketide synthase [Apostichopus japonicus]
MEDFRTECCWMDEQSWVDIVANCGFTEVVAVSSPKNLFHSIIVGKKTGVMKEQSRITTTIEGTVRKPRNFERMTYSEMKTRKSIVNGIKQPTGKAECVFLCNKCDNHVENLLRYLEYIEKESEHVSRAWVVFASTAEEDSRDASLVASIGSGIADNTDHAARVPCAGIVLQVGEDVNAVQPMDEVFILSPQNISSHLIASPFSVIKKPKSLSWSECVSSVLPFSLAYYCLIERARLSRGERLLVHSLHSTISLASIQIGRLVGADVTIYVGTKDEAQIFLNIEGVTVFVNEATADSDNGIKHVEHGTKFDVVLTQASLTYRLRSMMYYFQEEEFAISRIQERKGVQSRN